MPLQLQGNETVIIGFRSASAGSSPCAISSIHGKGFLSYIQEGNLYAHLHGPAQITSTSGKCFTFNVSPPPATNLSTWDLSIEDWHAPSDPYKVETAITMHNFQNQALVPWYDLGPGFDAVSGVGRYNTTFTIPAAARGSQLGAMLSLGPVVHTMRAFLNGQRLPPIDPSNPVVDISSFVRAGGVNEIMVEVTTPLFNRIKATANETMVVEQKAGVLQPGYASTPPQAYGLLGPVVVEWTVREEVKC